MIPIAARVENQRVGKMKKWLIEILPDGKARFDCKHEEPSFELSGEGNTEENPSRVPILRWQI